MTLGSLTETKLLRPDPSLKKITGNLPTTLIKELDQTFSIHKTPVDIGKW